MKVIANYKYNVDENNTIEIWNNDVPNENDAPFIRQPVAPEGRPWNDAEEATTWAEAFIDGLLNPPPSEVIIPAE